MGGSLTTFFNEAAQALTRECARRICEEGADHVLLLTRMNTPVRSGELRSSWKRGPVEPMAREGAVGWRATVSTDVSYAPYVEHGTGLWGPKHAPYLIVPKKPGGRLRFVVGGKVVYATHVVHPGSPGNHMLEIGMLTTQGLIEMGSLFHGALEAWVRGVEGGAH